MISNEKLFSGMLYTAVAMAVTVAGGYVYSHFFEEPYLTYKNVPFVVDGITVPGGPASSSVIRCSTSDKTEAYKTTRNFQKMGANQPAIILPSIDVTVEPGCEPGISRINVVPDNTLPGYYRFYGVASVEGLFTTHKVAWGTSFFEVAAKPPAPAPVAPVAPVAAPASSAVPPTVAIPLSGAPAAPLLLPITNAVVKIEVKP